MQKWYEITEEFIDTVVLFVFPFGNKMQLNWLLKSTIMLWTFKYLLTDLVLKVIGSQVDKQ